MSGHNWEPGDVALVNDCTRPDRPWEAATCTAARTPERETTWRLHRNGGEVWGSVSEARPLVVIDPEDREQVKRLDDLLWATRTAGEATDDLQAALREFAAPTPPKPDEPQGLGAVVEDNVGDRWVRSHPEPKPWTRPHLSGVYTFDEVPAVRVLSEGVVL